MACLSGCGDDSAPIDDDLSTLRVRVVDPSDDNSPRSGVRCALDKPGGVRLEATTDSEGFVVFEGLNWALGTASLVSVPDRVFALMSLTSGDVYEGELWLYLTPPTSDDGGAEVVVSGAALNRVDARSTFFVQSTVAAADSDSTASGANLFSSGETLRGFIYAQDGFLVDTLHYRRSSRARPFTFTQ